MAKVKQKRLAADKATKKSVKEQADRYFSRVVGKALDLLEILRNSDVPLSLNELTLRVGMIKSTVFRILYTLESAGYVMREAEGKYALHAEARALVPRSLRNRLLRAAVPEMKKLNQECGETVSLALLLDNHIEVVAVVESPHLIRMANIVGRILPPHASSLGKTISAFQPEDVRERLTRSYGIYAYTEHSITDEVKLKEELDRIRSCGYGTDIEESVLGGFCFGAPIYDGEGRVVAAISISIPKMRLKGPEEQARVPLTLKEVAAVITERMQSDK